MTIQRVGSQMRPGRVGLRGAIFWLGAGLAAAQGSATFSATGSLTVPRQFHTATLLPNGKVLITGGFATGTGNFTVWASAELYDPSNGSFARTGDMTTARHMHSATLLANGKVLIAGGQFQNGGPGQASAELYDPVAGTFSATGSMITARGFHTATLLNNGRVLIAGGNYPAIQTTELYDPSTGTFSATGDMTEPGADTATPLPDGKVLITRSVLDLEEDHADLYDPGTGTFSRTGDILNATSAGHYNLAPGQQPTATLMINGKVLVAGGSWGDVGGSTVAEIFDPAGGVFSATGNLTAGIDAWSAATLLPDGRVLIAGRYDGVACSPVIGFPALGGTCPGTAELYDPAAAAFGPSSIFQSMEGHASTLLPDGAVLLSGGWVCCGTTIGTAQLYRPPVLSPAPKLFALSNGQGAIQHANTYALVTGDNPADAGETIVIYGTGLIDGSVIPPQVAIGGRMAEVLWFGNTPGYPGLNQINARVPSGVAAGGTVPVRMNYLARPSNEVTIGVR